MKSPHAPVSAEVDPLDREVNRALTTRFTCRTCIELRQTLSQYVARDRDRATARRIAVEVYAETAGRQSYEAYRDHTGGISLATGGPIPMWPDLSPVIKAAWGAAANALLSEVAGGAFSTQCEREKNNATR